MGCKSLPSQALSRWGGSEGGVICNEKGQEPLGQQVDSDVVRRKEFRRFGKCSMVLELFLYQIPGWSAIIFGKAAVVNVAVRWFMIPAHRRKVPPAGRGCKAEETLAPTG
jgi:hypothetical protein